MNPAQASTLRNLLATQPIAALGTLHEGDPFVSMVPFALLPGGTDFLIHVSQLSAHTQDMLTHTQVSLLVIAPPSPEVPAQALARMTVQGLATQLPESTPGHAAAERAYLARFPNSATMFELPDFSLFAIRPRSIRFIGGFGQALTLTPEMLAEALRGA